MVPNVNEVFGWNRNRYTFIVPIPAKHPVSLNLNPKCDALGSDFFQNLIVSAVLQGISRTI